VEASGRPGRQTQSTTCRACSSRRWRASYDLYIRDAEEAGDEELTTFFIQVRDEDSMRAEEAQRLLAERTPAANKRGGTAAEIAEGAAAGLSPSMEPSSPPPRTTGGAAADQRRWRIERGADQRRSGNRRQTVRKGGRGPTAGTEAEG
jgi:hypothetical protein